MMLRRRRRILNDIEDENIKEEEVYDGDEEEDKNDKAKDNEQENWGKENK